MTSIELDCFSGRLNLSIFIAEDVEKAIAAEISVGGLILSEAHRSLPQLGYKGVIAHFDDGAYRIYNGRIYADGFTLCGDEKRILEKRLIGLFQDPAAQQILKAMAEDEEDRAESSRRAGAIWAARQKAKAEDV